MSEGFDARSLDERYAVLDQLPESLYQSVLLCPHGELRGRVEGLLRWRESLLAGALPTHEQARWPDSTLATPLLAEIERLGLPRFCQGEPELTDSVLLSVLSAVTLGAAKLDAETRARLDQLRRVERERQRAEEEARRAEEKRRRRGPALPMPGQSSGSGSKGDGGASAAREAGASDGPIEIRIDEATLKQLRKEAERLASQDVAKELAQHLQSEWEERVRVWRQLAEVFGELGHALGVGWDLSRGILKSQGWLEVMRLHELLKQLPALRELIEALGRMQTARPDAPSIMEEVLVGVRRLSEELRVVQSPLVPMETRGVERSGEVSRMLPSEAALLGHPVLKRLWHARRAERGLMSYRVEGTELDRAQIEEEGTERTQRPKAQNARGPILVCIDTSGSMMGLPEQVAKALVLEAMRVAHQEKRALYLYLFSGPGQVAERELSLSREGLAQLMGLLALSFHGGTDVVEPLSRAARRLTDARWSRADILLVSDGEFPVPSQIEALLTQARKHQCLRVHGVQIGASHTGAMQKLCDPGALHAFANWAELGATSASSTAR